MKEYSKHKIILNLGISMSFVLLSIYLLFLKSERNFMDVIPLNIAIGFLGMFVNGMFTIKWLLKLIYFKKS